MKESEERCKKHCKIRGYSVCGKDYFDEVRFDECCMCDEGRSGIDNYYQVSYDYLKQHY